MFTMIFLLVVKTLFYLPSCHIQNCLLTDFRFYEDLADEFKENEGSLLPLWKFEFSEAAGLENTALCWNSAYSDLFAVGYGSCQSDKTNLDFNNNFCTDNIESQNSRGLICVFSLKNPSYPEFICKAAAGVMCLDFHPTVSREAFK